MKKLESDILIIGAGPAGCTAAQMAAHLNLNTIIIDRQKFPRDKTCGDAITFSSLKELEKIGFDTKKIIENSKLVRGENIFIYDHKDDRIELENKLFFTLKRVTFDNLLWGNLGPAIKKMEQLEPKSIDKTENGYTVTLESNNESFRIDTKYLIGADGYSSYVRRNLFQDLIIEKRVASRFYLKDENFKSDAYHLFFHEKVSPGYFWIFEVGKNEYNTGVYLPNHLASKDLFDLHNHFIKKYFNREIDKNEFYTWPIPNNSDFTRIAKDNVILIGDAAGLCDKLLGHGIDAAILSGIVAVQSLNYHSLKNEKKYSLQEIYRYNMTMYFKDSLSHLDKVYEKIYLNKEESIQHLINTFKYVFH